MSSLFLFKYIRLLFAFMAFAALLGRPGAVSAAEGPAVASGGSTVLSGKVMSPVIRSAPMPFTSIVDEVLVAPGDKVEKGAPLVRYHLEEAAARNLQREITMGAGTENLRSQVLNMQSELGKLSAERNKARQLVASKLGSAQSLSRLEGDVGGVQKRIELTRDLIAKQEENFNARLQELEGYFDVKLKSGDKLPKSLTLKSPMDGHVLSVDLTLHPGALVPAGASPIRIGQLDPMLIQVQVYESEISRIKEGDKAVVQIPSLNDKEFGAVVTNISWTSTELDVNRPSFYMVEFSVPNPNLELKPGFKAVVRIGTGPRQGK